MAVAGSAMLFFGSGALAAGDRHSSPPPSRPTAGCDVAGASCDPSRSDHDNGVGNSCDPGYGQGNQSRYAPDEAMNSCRTAGSSSNRPSGTTEGGAGAKGRSEQSAAKHPERPATSQATSTTCSEDRTRAHEDNESASGAAHESATAEQHDNGTASSQSQGNCAATTSARGESFEMLSETGMTVELREMEFSRIGGALHLSLVGREESGEQQTFTLELERGGAAHLMARLNGEVLPENGESTLENGEAAEVAHLRARLNGEAVRENRESTSESGEAAEIAELRALLTSESMSESGETGGEAAEAAGLLARLQASGTLTLGTGSGQVVITELPGGGFSIKLPNGTVLVVSGATITTGSTTIPSGATGQVAGVTVVNGAAAGTAAPATGSAGTGFGSVLGTTGNAATGAANAATGAASAATGMASGAVSAAQGTPLASTGLPLLGGVIGFLLIAAGLVARGRNS